jgi:hypothetical protein
VLDGHFHRAGSLTVVEWTALTAVFSVAAAIICAVVVMMTIGGRAVIGAPVIVEISCFGSCILVSAHVHNKSPS